MSIFSLAKTSLLIGTVFFMLLPFSQTVQAADDVVPVKDESVVAKTPKEDATVTKTVKQLIHESKTLSKLHVNVSTNKGVVKLTGTVDADTQVTELVELAETVIGVSDVNTSDLKVKDGKQPVADSIITAKIKGLFIREKLFGEKDIAAMNTSVETKDGVVYLSGVVDNQAQIDNAIEIIKKNVPEVKKVEYNLKKTNS